jgi:hypothetical protein
MGIEKKAIGAAGMARVDDAQRGSDAKEIVLSRSEAALGLAGRVGDQEVFGGVINAIGAKENTGGTSHTIWGRIAPYAINIKPILPLGRFVRGTDKDIACVEADIGGENGRPGIAAGDESVELKLVLVIVGIHLRAGADLFEIVETLHGASAFFCSGEGREEQAGEDANDSDDD